MSMQVPKRSDPVKVSIITPYFHAEKYVAEAVASVIGQSYDNWELLLINDGSPDRSRDIARSFLDPRIRHLDQANMGVSAARNKGLASMTGSLFVFLDADDKLTMNSLASRVSLFESNVGLTYVDGRITKMDKTLRTVLEVWSPGLVGNPFDDLITLGGLSFSGPSWMVKREQADGVWFKTGLTHGEDLLFYLELARRGGEYAYVSEPVLYYRNSPGSAMKDLTGLDKGYRDILSTIKGWPQCNGDMVVEFERKTKRIMFRSYLRNLDLIRALQVCLHRQTDAR